MNKKRGTRKGLERSATPLADIAPPKRSARPNDGNSTDSETTKNNLRGRMPEFPRDLLSAVGLSLFVVLRPFRDGVTWEYDNFYFLWGILLLFGIWGLRSVFKGENLRFRRHILLLGAFLVVAALSTLDAVRMDNSYRTLLIWIGHFLLFALAANTLRNRIAIGMVLGAFVLSTLAESVYALVHYNYVLPYVRLRMIQDPSLLASQFGTTELSPDLAHRLNVKRAFGSLLFANALAAFLVLGIPYLAGEAANSIRRFLKTRQEALLETRPDNHRLVVAITVAVVWFLGLAVSLFLYPLVHQFRFGNYTDLAGHVWEPVLFVGLLPLAVAAVPGYFIGRYGTRTGWAAVRGVFLPMALLLSMCTLWLSYSRGGMLALILALASGGALLWWGRDSRLRPGHGLARAGAVAATLLVAAAALSWSGPLVAQPMANAPAAAPPAATPLAQAPQPAAPAQPQPGAPRIIPEGVNLTLGDLANPATIWMRVEYWKMALKIARDHFWTGVGLWNFQTVYAQYQSPNTPPVKEAHNDYLQVFSETGIFGFLLFLAFWGYFLFWGAKRVVEEREPGERWALVGLYTGVLAFLLHSVVDFNFYNPGLAALAFALAGIFLARVGREAPAPKRGRQPVALVAMLVATGLTLGATVPIYAAYFPHRWLGQEEAWVGAGREEGTRLEVARMLTQLDPARYRYNAPESLPHETLRLLIPGRKNIERFGRIYVPVGRTRKPLEPGDALPRTGLLDAVVVIKDPLQARQTALSAIRTRIATLEKAYSYYPYDPDVATHLFQWHDLLRGLSNDPAEQREHILALVKWSERGVAMSPEQAWFHQLHGNALLHRGMAEKNGAKRLELFQDALREYRAGTELAPSSSDAWRQFGDAMVRYGNALKALKGKGFAANAEKVLREGEAALQRSKELPQGT